MDPNRWIVVDIDFVVQIEGGAVFLHNTLFNLRISAVLLLSELVAWEARYAKTLSFMFYVQSLKLFVVLVGQTSVSRHVDDEQHFPA